MSVRSHSRGTVEIKLIQEQPAASSGRGIWNWHWGWASRRYFGELQGAEHELREPETAESAGSSRFHVSWVRPEALCGKLKFGGWVDGDLEQCFRVPTHPAWKRT